MLFLTAKISNNAREEQHIYMINNTKYGLIAINKIYNKDGRSRESSYILKHNGRIYIRLTSVSAK